MARKIIKKVVKEAVKKGVKKGTTTKRKSTRAKKPTVKTPSPLTRTPAAQRRTAQRKARADRSAKPKSAPTPITRTPAAQKRRSQRAARTASGTAAATAARTSSTTAAKQGSRASKIPTAAQAAIAAPAVGLTALAVTSRKKPETEGTFGEAFKAARKQGEGTKFTYKGKQYTAVTKDDLKRKGYDANELRQYMNRKGKARGPLNRLGQGVKKVLLGKDKKFGGDKGAIDFIRGRKKPVKKSGKPGSRKMAKFKAGGAVMANRGLGKAYMKSKR